MIVAFRRAVIVVIPACEDKADALGKNRTCVLPSQGNKRYLMHTVVSGHVVQYVALTPTSEVAGQTFLGMHAATAMLRVEALTTYCRLDFEFNRQHRGDQSGQQGTA